MTINEAKQLFTNNLTKEYAYVDQDGYSDGIFLTGAEWLADMESTDTETWGTPDFIENN